MTRMHDTIHIFKDPKQLAIALVKFFLDVISEKIKTRNKINIAISGGTTPALFFRTLAKPHAGLVWKKIHIFWVDERCVPPVSAESNYGMARRCLLDNINIPETNIHRIIGEADPEIEAKRYSAEIKNLVNSDNYWPLFDWILLGLGEDGHTASLFPDSVIPDTAHSLSAVTIHPQTNQRRITLTLPVINHADRITFLVSGHSKAHIVKNILFSDKIHSALPAALVKPARGTVEWFLDRDAAGRIS